MEGIPMLILSVGGIILMLFFVTYASQRHNLNSIKDKTVGNGQHGTARWATQQEVRRTYHHVPFTPEQWRLEAREGKQPTAGGKPLPQGVILGSKGLRTTIALVDSDDVHVLMIGASGVGKTAYFLYPNLEYACASGMSFLALDTKGDLARNYGAIARDIYGYRISVVDLREPTRSDGNNLLTLINRYMDKHRDNPRDIGAKANAEKYAKILAKTIINPEGDNTDRGQNAYFYDSAEGLLASVVLLLSEFLPPEAAGGYELRHIASVFKLVQELLMESSSRRGGNQFQELMQLLPADHKAKWLAGSALTASDQGMNSIMSTVLSKLNAFLDTELEQVICFDGGIDAELFVRERCAIFLILPEEDATKNFVASLMIQNLARELFSVANEHGGRLPNRAVFFCDELGTMPPFDILPLFSAGRSRRLTLVPIIQSLAQLEKNYGKEGSEILCDNCQDTIFGGFAPNSQTAAALSDNLGSRTVLSGTITKGRNDDSQSLQMMERPLMSPDELKSMPKGSFVVMKTGTHPMRTKLKLFYDWGIRFEKPLEMPDRGSRPVHYAGKAELEKAILGAYPAIHTLPVAEAVTTTGVGVKSMPNSVGIKTTL
jgi:type IV secretion system protein VirD4